MPTRAGSASRWEARIARARSLAATHPAAAEALTFYAALAEYQKSLVDLPPKGGSHENIPLENIVHDDIVLGLIPAFLEWLPQVAPVRLAESVSEMRRTDRAEWRHLLRSYSTGDPDLGPHVRFVVEALRQPFAEQSAIRRDASGVDRTSPDCPHCGGPPVVGVLREEGHGARRALLCGLCLMEHEYLRVVCPSCGEQQFEALPVYTADRFGHARIDACDRCQRYLKTIDLSKDGLAVPIVDDIATVSLDLWARERGYVRLRPNLLGL